MNLKRRGIELNDLKEFLGHEKLETTMVYLKMDKEDVKVAVTQAYAYPKKRNYYLPEKEDPNKAMLLRLENENLKLKNENLRIQLKLQLQPSVVAR